MTRSRMLPLPYLVHCGPLSKLVHYNRNEEPFGKDRFSCVPGSSTTYNRYLNFGGRIVAPCCQYSVLEVLRTGFSNCCISFVLNTGFP